MLPVIIAQLEQLVAQVKASGPVADVDARLDISTHSKSGYEYARLRNGSELTSCGRVGSEKYVEVLATFHRRDKIAQLTQAISSLKRASEIPTAITASIEVGERLTADSKSTPVTQPKPKSAAAKKQKVKGRKQLYTHVQTRQGSVVHAVLGKDKNGAWHTAALCGATPPQRDRMGWEFPTHDDGVTCANCYRKLPANGKRHLPTF